MQKLFLSGVTAAAIVAYATANPASAAPITYDFLPGTSITFGAGGTDTVTGSFTFDSGGPTLSAPDIVLTGPILPGSYNGTIAGGVSPFSDSFAVNLAGNAADILQLAFAASLGTSPDPLAVISPSGSPTFVTNGAGVFATAVTGGAAPVTPLPSSVSLFASALGLIGLIGVWRQRHAVCA